MIQTYYASHSNIKRFRHFSNQRTRNLKSKGNDSAANHVGTVVGTPASGAASQLLRHHAETTLGSGALRQAVMLPEGEDLNEWIAVHIVDFYNQINMLYGTITEFCSPKTCPKMMATEEYEYLWQDGQKYKRPTSMSAPEYIENLMNWVQQYLENEAIFPTKIGLDFSKEAPQVFRNILKRLFRVYGHIYCHHFDEVEALGILPHLNTSLKHFILFSNQFNLIDQKEFAPLQELITLLLNDKQQL